MPPVQNVIEVIVLGSVIVGAVFLFLWLRHFFDDRASALGAASFVVMPYLLYDIFTRGSVGEVLAIGTCMIALYAIESKRAWLIGPTIAFLSISHNTLALFFLPILFGYILLKKYFSLIVPFILGFGMSAFFWVPIFFERSLVLFDGVAVSDPLQYFSVSQLLVLKGSPFLIIAAITIFFQHKKTLWQKEQWYFFSILLGSLFLASQISAFIWQYQSLAKFMQFPYRVLSVWIFAAPWFIAYIANEKKNTKGFFLSIIAVVLLFTISLPYQQSESMVRSEGFFTTNESTTTVANEYMPKWVTQLPLQRAPQRFEFYKGNGTIEEHRATTEKIDIAIHAKEDSILQINTLYYPGWGAMLDNKPVTVAYDNPMGVMRVAIPAGDHQFYTGFRETGKRFMADILSALCAIVFIILFVMPSLLRSSTVVVTGKKK
jgi:hypothetical protein